jgi:phage terminase Nu1 subunit (DNA packaging protein)
VVFIILAGDGLDARQRFADLQLQHVDFLTPELAAGVEADARQQTINVRTLANIACNG